MEGGIGYRQKNPLKYNPRLCCFSQIMKVGIFGGTFNPIHYGHLRAAEEVREKLGLDRVLFVPSGNPPLKTKDIAPARHRFAMVKLAVKGNRLFQVSDIESRLPGKSYTFKTIEALQKENPRVEFSLILGIDAFLDIPNWWRPEHLLTLSDFIIISRPGYAFLALQRSPYIKIKKSTLIMLDASAIESHRATLPDQRDAVLLGLTPLGISSTEIRRLARLGSSIKYLLPPTVQSYIMKNKLYKS
jgi:nicotinate-nucleotide adenylyltransferase